MTPLPPATPAAALKGDAVGMWEALQPPRLAAVPGLRRGTPTAVETVTGFRGVAALASGTAAAARLLEAGLVIVGARSVASRCSSLARLLAALASAAGVTPLACCRRR